MFAQQGLVDLTVVYLPKLTSTTFLEMMGDVEFPVLIFGSHQAVNTVHIVHFHEVRFF